MLIRSSASRYVASISRIRTDLATFSEAESDILINHGYYLAEAAIKRHIPTLARASKACNPPYPKWMDKGKVATALKHSDKRPWVGCLWLGGKLPLED
jgi:hypothetical protein